MQKWEYMMTMFSEKGLTEKLLDQYGSDGWELVSVVYVEHTLHYYFKRPA